MRTIVIVGGGFCGTVLATMLLREPHRCPTRLALIERTAVVGRGVAFAARDYPYLLNVPAGRMSANPADPREFLRFMQRRGFEIDSESIVTRAAYGDYLEESLRTARLSATANVRLEVIRASAAAGRALGGNRRRGACRPCRGARRSLAAVTVVRAGPRRRVRLIASTHTSGCATRRA